MERTTTYTGDGTSMREKSLLDIVMEFPQQHRTWRQYATVRDALDEAHRALTVRYDANIGAEVVAKLTAALEIMRGVRMVWIPEAPNFFPPVYANESDDYEPGKIKTGEKQPSTMLAEKAKHFATREECQAWCDANPTPRFMPREHGFSV